jgi:type III pantothenate kinase
VDRTVLALDLGNSSLKACLLPTWDGAPSALFEGGDLAPWLSTLSDRPDSVALSSVARAGAEDRVLQDLRAADLPAPQLNPDCGLRLDLETPKTTGVDRLYAARAAVDLVGGPCVIVDAGTALTVDAATPGEFLGGAIAPGPDLLARALTAGGARLPEFTPGPGAPALGRSTEGALRAGVGVGFEGAAVHLVERVAAEAGFDGRATVVLTGGARGYLTRVLEGRERALIVEPILVLRGLARALVR